ncbi:MAG: Phosphatidylglycerophosphatase A [candidate division TM6 bacterium GW2011_GWE2_42_60]|nr:MAG: Phosphatidylglycerophosphatase A [candidate division TM6 bacterium GW2011_GWE2_42_60]HBY05649.1 phosphatidylglycerophosphatase A [Candidatus Dependentiae bacterium]
MNIKILGARVCALIASLGPVGYLPYPGTCGTLCAIPLLIGMRRYGYAFGLSEMILFLLLAIAAFFIIDYALTVLVGHDPQEIVLDEVVGLAVALYGLPFTPINLLLAFLLFRFFDGLKPLGIEALENFPGAFGVMGDDLAAGAMAHMVMVLILPLLR